MPVLGSAQPEREPPAGDPPPAALSKANCCAGSPSADSLENAVNAKQACRISSK